VLLSTAGDVVYDEIFPWPARLMVTDVAGQGQVILLADGNGLAVYRPSDSMLQPARTAAPAS